MSQSTVPLSLPHEQVFDSIESHLKPRLIRRAQKAAVVATGAATAAADAAPAKAEGSGWGKAVDGSPKLDDKVAEDTAEQQLQEGDAAAAQVQAPQVAAAAVQPVSHHSHSGLLPSPFDHHPMHGQQPPPGTAHHHLAAVPESHTIGSRDLEAALTEGSLASAAPSARAALACASLRMRSRRMSARASHGMVTFNSAPIPDLLPPGGQSLFSGVCREVGLLGIASALAPCIWRQSMTEFDRLAR